jgi:hypothetical protein
MARISRGNALLLGSSSFSLPLPDATKHSDRGMDVSHQFEKYSSTKYSGGKNTCSICGKSFSRPASLRRHLKTIHPTEAGEEFKIDYQTGMGVRVPYHGITTPFKVPDYVSNREAGVTLPCILTIIICCLSGCSQGNKPS